MSNSNLYWDSNESDNIVVEETPDVTIANPDNVLKNIGFRDALTLELKFGQMPVNPDLLITMSVGDHYVIPKGYHSGKTIINVLGLRDSTLGTATEDDIVENKIAWVDGIRLVGKLNLSKNNMEATATSSDLLKDRTAWVNGEKVIGNIPVILREDKELIAGESYVIPKGYHGGEAIISGAPLSVQTVGSAIPTDIAYGKVAWVNGLIVVGEAKSLLQTIADATAFSDDIRLGLTAYVATGKVLGSMEEYLTQPTRTLTCGTSFKIPKGYHDGLWNIQAASLFSQTRATASKADIRKGTTAWVDGELLEGELIQNFAPNTEGTAVANDIQKDKTAWVNGEKVIGTNIYNTIGFTSIVENKTSPLSPVIVMIPDHNWDLVRCIIVQVYSTIDNSELNMYAYYDFKSNTVQTEKSGNKTLLSIITDDGSPKIIVTSFTENTYIKVFVSGYTRMS